ncbi:hypothetical protein [Bacillus sp. BS98]|uniref:hypothetical protein n=1 Tax=Bacillus sp. BS98 TaxID=2608254 RepID=UPI001C0EBF7F|nr:hypothetical protein [Bacillus sp. BS98]
MTEVKFLKSMCTSFDKEVIKLTPQVPEKAFFTRSCEHLLSVLSIYIMSEKFVNEAPRAVKYNGLVGRDVPCTSQNKHHGLEIILLLSVLQIRFINKKFKPNSL